MIEISGIEVQLKNEYYIEKNATEDRAGGSIVVFSSRPERFETYDLVEITENNSTEQYLVQSDTIVKYDESRYEHTINLVECAAKFDAYYPADRTHSRIPPRSIGAILNIYATELMKYHNLEITWDFQADWAQTPIRNKEYESVNFSVIVQDLFREINARPVVNYINDKWEITPYFFNNRNNEIGRFDYPNSQLKKQNNLDYATKVKAKLKNAVYTMDDGVYFPSPNGYIIPKSSTPQKITGNLQYELDSGIINIEEAIVVGITIEATSNSITTETYTGNADISAHVVTKEEWDILPNFNNDGNKGIHKKNTLFYSIGDNKIQNIFVPQGGLDFWILNEDNRVLERAIVNAAQDQQLGTYTGQEQGTENNFITTDLDKVKLRIKYTRQRDLDIMHHRQYLKNMNESTQIHNQSSSFVDMQSKKNNLKAISNRMGNEVREESKVWEYNEQPYELGDYKNNYVIIKIKNTYKNSTILQEYVLAENFGNINGETSLWREPSPFTRTRKNVTTNLQFEEFVEISRESKNVSTRLLENARNNVMFTLDSSKTPTDPIATAIFRPVMQTANIVASNGVIMPVFTGGGGNVTTLHVQFTDTYSAGISFSDNYENGNFGENLIYAFPADENAGAKGELVDFRLFFSQDQEYLDQGRYPLVESLSNYLTDAMSDPNVLDTINKDINSRLAITYNQHFVTDNKDIIIGNAWAKYNRLITDIALGSKKMYKRETPYTIYDTHADDRDTEISGTWSITTSTRKLTINTSTSSDYYAIAYDDEILLAFNDKIFVGSPEVFYINFTEQAERVVVNQLESPSDYGYIAQQDELRIIFFNPNIEGVTIEVTLNNETQTENVGPAGSTPQELIAATATFDFTGLTAGTNYDVEAQSLPLAGSAKAASATALYTAATLPPSTVQAGISLSSRTESTLIVEFTNNDTIPVTIYYSLTETNPGVNDNFLNLQADGQAGDTDTVTFQFLDAGTQYTVYFKTTSSTKGDANVTQSTYTTRLQLTAPNYGTASTTSTSIKTFWGNPNEVSVNAEIIRFSQGTPVETKTVNNIPASPNGDFNVEFTSLTPNSPYTFNARFKDDGFKAASTFKQSPIISTDELKTETPTIEILSKTTTSVSYRLTNNEGVEVEMYWEIDDPTPDANTANVTTSTTTGSSGLVRNNEYILYARAIRPGYSESDVAEQPFITKMNPATIGTISYITAGPDVVQVSFDWSQNNGGSEPINATINVINGANTQVVTGGNRTNIDTQTYNESFNLSQGDIAAGETIIVEVILNNGDTTETTQKQQTT